MDITNKKFWGVRDPGPVSVIQDVFVEFTLESYANYIAGMLHARIREAPLTFYDDEQEAKTDAEARLAARDARRKS